jgi:hypothetical protein
MKRLAKGSQPSFVFPVLLALCLIVLGAVPPCLAQSGPPPKPAELMPGSAVLISPEELAKILQSPGAQKPLILSIGPRLLYAQAHIAGAEFIGPTADPEALQRLRDRIRDLPRNTFLVLYCGCCPWSRCPNVEPAYRELRRLGFTKAKVLYIADNLGTDWVYKGYPTAKSQ